MKKMWMMVGAAMTAATCGSAWAGVDLSVLDASMVGPRAQVLVLGSVHLSGMETDAGAMEPLLERLAAFKPDVITIENIAGEGCDLLARYPDVYPPDNVAPYCTDNSAAKKATGLDVPAATAAANKTLAQWPAQPTAAQRRHLAALFLAAGDPSSAVVQWLQLPQAEQHAGDGLDDALVAILVKRGTRNNESDRVAARLAARLGLQRVYPIDDHTGDNVTVADEDAYGAAIQKAWETGRPKAKAIREREQALQKSGDMLALYRYINTPEVLRIAIDADFGAAMRDPSPQHYGQLYVAGWETRNLRMVSNIRAAFRERPGARVLSVVGSSHKPWFDDLLARMQGVDVVDAGKVLGDR